MVEELEFRGDISGVGQTNAKIYIENMNDELGCDVLQNEVKQFLERTPAQEKMALEQDSAQ